MQDRLRDLVDAKIALAQHQIGELMTFTSELQHAAAQLQGHRPEGACDADCGCVSAADTPPMQAVSLTTRRVATATDDVPIACTLTPTAIGGRIDDWRSLLSHVARRAPLDDGVRVEFSPSVPPGELLRLAVAEQDCCRFLRFAITVDERGVALEVRAPADARPLVDSVFGVAA